MVIMESLINTVQIKNFPSLNLISLELNTTYYFLTPLSSVLGYTKPNSLIHTLPKEYRVSCDEVYSLYTLYYDQFMSYIPLSEKSFKRELSVYKPLWFTTQEGIKYILSRNTCTLPRLKESIAESLGFTLISQPRNESLFFDALFTLLKGTKVKVNRHLYIAGYFVDIELSPINVIVEYDENDHKYYDKNKELKRENVLKQLGYNILRESDSKPPIESASSIFKQLLPYLEL